MMDAAICVQGAVKMENGRRVLSGATLSVGKGECVTVCGPPGSGKSALARLIAGMDRPGAGEVIVLGQPVHALGEEAAAAFRSRHIGVLLRDPAFLEGLTLLENTALPLVLRGDAKARGKAREQLKTLGLLYAAPARPAQLTPLERHKAAVARMLAARPDILLLDDFAAGLDERGDITGILRAVCEYGGMTVLELTGEAQGLICENRTLRLERGVIREETV